MHIAILTFRGFKELDSLVALGILNRITKPGWRVSLCRPEPEVTSMNGKTIRAQSRLEDALATNAAMVGSVPACTDLTTQPREAGIKFLNQPFYASGKVATAGEKEACVANAMQHITPYLLG